MKALEKVLRFYSTVLVKKDEKLLYLMKVCEGDSIGLTPLADHMFLDLFSHGHL